MRTDYRAIADELAAEIADGRIRAGERLPPQRAFAFERGMSPSTATRVYGELVRRRLVAGEVGRGSYVLARGQDAVPALVEPSSAPVDLEMVAPFLSSQRSALAKALAEVAASPDFDAAARPGSVSGTRRMREGATRMLGTSGWRPDPDAVLFAGSGKQALAAVFDAVLRPGDRLGVEALTYPFALTIAAARGIELVPLALDGCGLVPGALVAAHGLKPLRAVYFQSAMQNPTAVTMPPARRRELAAALRATGTWGIEDGIYSFLEEAGGPVAALHPDGVVHVESLSKRVAPGFALGMVVVPQSLHSAIAHALRSGGLFPSGLSLAVGGHVMSDGTARRLGDAKRLDARARQALARTILAPDPSGDQAAYHLWLPLPEPWRGEAFAAEALRLGIGVVPGRAFAASPGHAPPYVRVALAALPRSGLAMALRRLARLTSAKPTDGIA